MLGSSSTLPLGQPRLAMALALCLGFVAAFLAQPVSADLIDPSYIYGIADNNDIYQINPDQKTFGVVYNTGLTRQSNAFAFDRDRDQMFFVNQSGTFNSTPYSNGLFLWNKPTGVFSLLATSGTSFGVTGTIPANAAYHDNAFWFFNEGSLALTKANLAYSGTGSAAIPTGISSVQTFLMSTGTSLTASQNNFGDIAINVDTNTLYGYTAAGGTGGKFYSLALSDPTSASSFNLISATPTIGLQLSFNEDYTKLYGHNYSGGKWYDINTSTGALTDLNFTTTTSGTNGFRDLGGASIVSVPEPASIAILASGLLACSFAAHRLNRRRRSRQ